MTEAHAVKHETLVSSKTHDCEYASLPSPEMHIDIDSGLVALLEGQYVVEERIGKGAQSHVYRGKRLSDNMPVAIKQMRVNSAKNWKQYELFEREANVLKTLNVPGTAKFYDAIKSLDGDNPTSVIIQEYIDGRSLQSYIDQQTRFSFEVVCGILLQILEILKKLHHQKPPIIHRDIKPSNIILRYDDDKYAQIPEVFIIDFGAVANPQVKDGGSTVTGTYGYMAPEQLIGHPEPASDLYSFGILAVYLFSGVPPEKIEMKDLQLLIDPHLEHLPYMVTSFLRQLIEPNLTKRLTDYDAIRKSLRLFHNNKFEFSLKNRSQKDTNEQLEHIQSVGQKGSVALWQDLPHNTPRKIPKVYKKMIQRDTFFWPLKNIDISYVNFRNYQECVYAENVWLKYVEEHEIRASIDIHKNRIKNRHVKNEVVSFARFLLFFLMYSPLVKDFIYLCVYCATTSEIVLEHGLDSFVTFWTIISYLILLNTPKFFRNRWNCRQIFHHEVSRMLPPYIKQYQFKRRLSYIFKRGRKTLATIVSIELIVPEYKPSRDFSGHYRNDGKRRSKKEIDLDQTIESVVQEVKSQHEAQRAKLRPLWKIEYYFNPPDDNSPYPVHHVYYSEVPPVDLKIGDTLPILYYIRNDRVFSVPYPLPAGSSLMQCPNLVEDLGIHIRV